MVAQLLKTKTTIVWFGLVVATIISWQVGEGTDDAKLASTLVMAIAFIKVRFVGLWFMELKDAPIPLRAIFETYCLVVGASVIIMYHAV